MQSINDEIVKMSRERENDVRKGLDRLRFLVRRYPLNELLFLFSSFNWPHNNAWEHLKIKTKDNHAEGLIYWIYLPALAKYAILHSNDHVGEPNRSVEKAFKEVEEMLTIVNDLKDWIPFHLYQNPKFAFDVFKFQLMNQHFPFQEKPHSIIGRSLALFRDIPEKINFRVDLLTAFQEIYGISLQKFWVLTINLLTTYHGDWISRVKFGGLDKPPLFIKHEEMIKYLGKLSLSYKQFRELANDPEVSFKGISNQFYGYSPFDSHPIVIRNDEFLIISPHYFVRRMFLPIYFDLLDHFQVGDNPKDNRFSTSFGEIFQVYVGKQLEYLKDGSELIPELEYDRDRKKFVDWILKYENKAVFIEVKKNVLALKAKFIFDEKFLRDSLKKTLVKGLKQCHTKIKHLENALVGLERLKDVKEVYPIVVTFDDTYLLNSDFIREIIDQELVKEGISFQNKWQVLTIRELEIVVTASRSDQTFLELLRKKIKNPDYLKKDWDNFLNTIGQPAQENEMLTEIIRHEFEKISQGNIEAG